MHPCNALPHALEAVGSVSPAMHRLTACWQWAMELMQCTPSVTPGSG